MNDFTKEELQTMQANLPYIDGEPCELSDKIQSLIDNYCEHETTYTDYDSQPVRCKKCLDVLDDA